MDLEKNKNIEPLPDPIEAVEGDKNEKPETALPAVSKDDQTLEREAKQHEVAEISKIREKISDSKPNLKQHKDHLKKEVIPKIGLHKHLKNLLADFRKEAETAKEKEVPAAFRAAIELAIENGLADPETLLFFTFAGIAEGILDHEDLADLYRRSNQFPLLEGIKDEKGNLMDSGKAMDLIRKQFAKSYKSGAPGNDFRNYFWRTLSNEPRIQEKLKTIDPNKMDHDHLMWFMSGANGERAKKMLRGPIKETAAANAYAGVAKWIEENRSLLHSDPKRFAGEVAAFVTMDGILKNVAYAEDKGFMRFNETKFMETPRGSNATNHPKAGLSAHGDFIWNAIEPLDKPLFKALRNHNPDQWPQVQKRLRKYGIQVDSIDKLYDRMDEVIEKIVAPGALSKWFGKYRKTANRLKTG